MRFTLSLRWLRWVLLALYLLLILSLVGTALLGFGEPFAVIAIAVVVLVFTFSSQALFLLGSGRTELSRPIRGWRLVIPAAMAGLLLALLVFGVNLALLILLETDATWVYRWRWALVPVGWIAWSLPIFIYCRGWERIKIIGRLTGLLFAGGLATLLVTIPALLIATGRLHWLAGLAIIVVIATGVYVMLWSFGTAIILLFMREKRRFELRETRRQAVGPVPRDWGAAGTPEG